MKLYELVNKYHIGTDLSCAEAMFKACNEYYELNLNEDTRKMFSIMGMGMQSEVSCCGAFTVAMAMIGYFTAQDNDSDYNNVRGYELACELTSSFTDYFSTLQCTQLQELKIDGYDNPCHAIVEDIAKKLEELLANEGTKCLA